jgi:replicative DNA helicase
MLMARREDAAPERLYPTSIVPTEGEYMMLAMLLNENRRVDIVADLLRGEDFAEPLFGRIYDRIVQLVSAGQQANPITLDPLFADDFSYQEFNGRAFLAGMTGGTATATLLMRPRDQANMIAECAARRRYVDATTELARAAADRTISIPSLIDQADSAVAGTIERREAPRQVSLSGSIAQAITRIEEIQANGGKVGAPCGIAEIDDLIGGFEAPDLILIGGRPGMGKTALAAALALGLARNGHGVRFDSLEMRSVQLGMRFVSDLCCRDVGRWIPFSAITKGTVTREQLETMRAAEQAVRSWPLLVEDVSKVTIPSLHRNLRRTQRTMAAQGQELKVGFVDYLQLMQSSNPKASTYDTVSEISKGLKEIAKDLGIAMVALAQLSRKVEERDDKRPKLADLRESGQLEQDADVVLFPYREEYYLKDEKPKPGNEEAHEARKSAAAGRMSLICAKRRSGPTGTADVQFLAAYQAVRSKDWGRL